MLSQFGFSNNRNKKFTKLIQQICPIIFSNSINPSNNSGPAAWGSVKEYVNCSIGKSQSPINIVTSMTRPTSFGSLGFSYPYLGPINGTFLNTGDTGKSPSQVSNLNYKASLVRTIVDLLQIKLKNIFIFYMFICLM